MSPYEHIRETLCADETFGVWSLIITLFGDMAQGQQHRISGTALTAICEKLKIKPQAMRVALHRLRKDGWIDSKKTGRNSTYFLTEARRIESANASPRIYAISPPPFTGFTVLFSPSERSTTLNPLDWIAVSDEVFVSFQNDPSSPTDAIVAHHLGKVPNWLQPRLIPSDLIKGYKEFGQRLSAIPEDQLHLMTPLEIVALRTLLVHGWRRLVLKHPALPIDVFPSDCPISECYERITTLLALLPRHDLTGAF